MIDNMMIMPFLFQQTLFYGALFLTMVAPGYLLILCSRSCASLHLFERLALSVPLGFSLTTFGYLFLGKLHITLTAQSVFLFALFLCCILLVVKTLRKMQSCQHSDDCREESRELFSWTRLQGYAFLLIATLMLFVKGFYLMNTIFPTSTDLGHHMFWVQKIMTTGELPVYEKVIVESDAPDMAATSPASFAGVQSIPDFIIGEHLIFAGIGLLSASDVVSAFPSLVLFLVHLITIFLMVLLALRIFSGTRYAQSAALWTFLFIGPLYAISGAQAKFVSGGVVGNIIGNMLIVAALYVLYRSLTHSCISRARSFLMFFFLLLFALIYTHHLSLFILGYVLVFSIVLYVLRHALRLRETLLQWGRLLFCAPVLVFLALGVTCLIAIHTPSYLNVETVSSATGTPEKSTRVGLPFAQVADMSGSLRFFLGALGALVLGGALIGVRKLPGIPLYALCILLGWVVGIFFMSVAPGLLGVNILSTRIAAYIIFPLALTAGFLCAWLIALVQSRYHPLALHVILFLVIVALAHGMRDNSQSLVSEPKTQDAVQTFHAADYLGSTLPRADDSVWSLKDHNYIVADTWMKVIFARYSPQTDYSNPLSRGFFARYESKPRREHCTLTMISDPGSPLAKTCFDNLSVSTVTVHTTQDSGQFDVLDDFVKVYENDVVTTYWRK